MFLLLFSKNSLNRPIEYQIKNATIDQKLCASSFTRMEILRHCAMLKFEKNYYILTQTITIAIKRHQSIIDILFTCVVMLLVTIGTLCIGCGLEIQQLVNNFKRPMPLIIGLICQIIYLPLLSYTIQKLFQLDNSKSLGLLSTATSPGKLFSFYLFK